MPSVIIMSGYSGGRGPTLGLLLPPSSALQGLRCLYPKAS